MISAEPEGMFGSGQGRGGRAAHHFSGRQKTLLKRGIVIPDHLCYTHGGCVIASCVITCVMHYTQAVYLRIATPRATTRGEPKHYLGELPAHYLRVAS